MVKKAFIVTIIGIILSATLVQSQAELDSYIEMLRSDLKTEKISIITEVMKFTEEEATAFWPVYREYDLELNKLFDQRIALIKDYAENFDAMTGEKAKDLINNALKIEDKRIGLKKKYFKKFDKVIGSINAAKFIQLERQMNLLIDVQIATGIPLVPDAVTPEEAEE